MACTWAGGEDEKFNLAILLLLIINVIVYSGFTGVGYPKIMPTVLADHVEKNGLQGKLKFNLFVGASTGAETEDRYVCCIFYIYFASSSLGCRRVILSTFMKL
jgi:hypothetical protein